jgi:hypothetical protein
MPLKTADEFFDFLEFQTSERIYQRQALTINDLFNGRANIRDVFIRRICGISPR